MLQSLQAASHTPAHLQLDPPRWWEFTNYLVSSSPLAARPGREILANGFSPVQSWLRLNLTALALSPRSFVTRSMDFTTPSPIPKIGS
ncbi:hypothetical protein CORC01_12002 [Colletotrichum orchidophilum]|uniref:Uncharacterized protein n=1 Tax=Colletotrichum orchidophilum TaxID=1209926 RepID=A0A1G4AUE3_9PEZI|nr:uncharacterized protein CORC01_12002 [Colletotrichum orchidophilum]OHE92721.1 hypothetical protein CORC01_12002 [Colletotrichum orchidophilum]